MDTETQEPNSFIDRMFKAGAHFGLPKARRHPSVQKHLFGLKKKNDIFDLEKTEVMLEKAKEFAKTLGAERKSLLFVGGKAESQHFIKDAAVRIGAPYCVGRWIGGTITNFSEIKKRISRLESLMRDRDTGELSKYTKLEQLHISRDIAKLETMYAGLVILNGKLPNAIFVVDPRHEVIAVKEARSQKIPVIALANSDCNLTDVDYVIPANDSSSKSIALFVEEIAAAYEEGLKNTPQKVQEDSTTTQK